MAEEHIELTFPDGTKKTYPKGTTGRKVAEDISKGLANQALSITVDGKVMELDRPLTFGGPLTINTWDSDDGQYTFWHSSAHLLAEAVQNLYPEAKFGIGPPIDNGFYYDIDFGDHTLSSEELSKLEDEMISLARTKSEFERKEVSKQDALEYYKEKGNEYKVELIKNLEDGEITFYSQGDFTDLCRGPHIPHTGKIKAVKLTSLAGAYWKGDSDNKQLTRIYGISFPKQKKLKKYLKQVEEAKKRDHKKLGKELQLFMIDSELVGPGLPIWLPKGTVVRRKLEEFMRSELVKRNYQEVITPHIANVAIYEKSGHYPYYQESQFSPMDVDDDKYMLKPMNCPHHHRIYSSQMRSYRELPIRLAEFGSVYRYEQSGELNGLSRVRGFTQDDAHIYCTHEQLKGEIKDCIELTQHVFGTFDMPVSIRLSYRDDNDDKYGGNMDYWKRAQKEIREVADEVGLKYTVAEGEASFYGPKIDFIIRDAIGRKWQLGTIQVDYVMPERFELTYVGSDNDKHRPVIIHRAPFGSLERFMSILIEHFAGDFPLWLAPTQVMVIPVSDQFNEYANTCKDALNETGIRVETDTRSEKLGSKIREAETQKIPYMLIVGSDEEEAKTVSVRKHKKGDIGASSLTDFIEQISKEINDKQLPDE